jgi:DNA polymerase III delta subunit
MPKLEPKVIQKELESFKVRPVYWFYGGEAMKSRELLKRIRGVVFGESPSDLSVASAQASAFASAFRETILDGGECEVSEVLDAAQSLSLGGGGKLVIVKQAHSLKQPESLLELCSSEFVKVSEGASVVVFISKDLDQRKKFTKGLIEKAACVPCEEIAEADREAWVGYLAKRKGLNLNVNEVGSLRAMDPWSLDGVDRELEKMESATTPADREAVLLGGAEGEGASENFVDAFLSRSLQSALPEVRHFADSPEAALPLLGLLSWNAKMLIGLLKDREAGTRETKLGSFLQDRFTRYTRAWTLSDAISLQSALARVDFSTKQTPRDPLGTWTSLVLEFCK